MLPNDAHAVPFRLAVRPKPCLPVSQAAFSSTASLLSCLRCTHRHLWWDRKEAIAKARDEAVDPFHGLPIPQTLASKISSSAIERLAVRRHFKPKDQRPYRPIPDRPGITGGPWQMRPLSRGYAGSVSPSS